jgi:4-hydroxybenzoate polyprenyltransferase
MTVTTGPAPTRPSDGPGRVRAFLRLVMIEHSIFALPFAYIAALTAGYLDDRRVHWAQVLLVTIAMVSARTFAMALNRIIDREIDARNPRTAGRELVTGALSTTTAWVGALAALLVFLAAAAALNLLAFTLAPLAVAPLVVYPYGKRFTNLPHVILGVGQAIGPIGAWIAVTAAWSWKGVLLGLAVGTWIGGFDLIFACQDVAADRAHGVKSVPARWGIARALYASRAAHAITLGLLIAYGVATHGHVLWWLGVSVVAVALTYEHSLVKPNDLSKLNRAFFTVNGFVGITLFCFALLDLIARGLRW